MTRRTRSLDSIKSQIEQIIKHGKSLQRETHAMDTDQCIGTRFAYGKHYSLTEEFRILMRQAVEKILEALGNEFIEEEEINEIIWNLIYKDICEKKTYLQFKNDITKYKSSSYRLIIANFQIRFEAGLQEVSIGPVRAILGSKLAGDLNKEFTPKYQFHSDSDYVDNKECGNFSLDAVCWDVSVVSSSNVAR